MPLIAIHQVRTHKGAPPEPVGIWRVEIDDGESYYPPDQFQYVTRAQKALLERPIPLEPWVQFKASTSSSWRIVDYQEQGLVDVAPGGEPSLVEIYRREHDLWSQAVSGYLDAEAYRSAPDTSSGQAGHGWGAYRFAIAQSWWLASELVRRHPHLIAYEMHPGGGMYDVLCVTDPRAAVVDQATPSIMLNRVGTIQVHAHGDTFMIGTWADVLEANSPHVMVKELEAAIGLTAPAKSPASTPRALAYRFFATVLNTTINDRHHWDVRCEYSDTSGYGGGRDGYLKKFPAIEQVLRDTPTLNLPGEPESHYWALLRNQEPLLIVSMEGKLYRRTGQTTDLMHAYQKHRRRIIPMTLSLINRWL